ncbi:ABC transporter ATP-binding protein [Mycobacterium conspicuum]|jgi:NitT/TauT family transport system ATP-binding protein|uniref:ABC transporter ATP-binding protein n=1 Tax=Mycobacterium conspicuum TaxID=44010 RepID=A0A1X1T606_9MYCO|nr:ABC transporter ATP-binding protein [Mycobacterium conspicuum]ORV39952.1 ABC transporter [Mycobacterium conspicuum]BBZ42391.1 ABC transporter ATP-binding protein [Mycobacterium conspicuum]
MTGGNLVLDAVGKEYRTAGAPVVAVQDFSLDIGAGEVHVIVGPSGCGKSTLLGAVAGFTDITSGRIDLDGHPLCGPGRPTAGIGPDRVVVFQDSTLFPWLTVADNVGYGLVAQRRLNRRDAAGIARARLQEVGLGDIAHSYPGELSSGVQRRVEILRALVMEPAVLLLDEPFRGMDAISRSAMHDALLAIYDKFAVTVLFITHDIEEAVYLGSRVTVMTTRPGRVKTTIDIDLDRPRDRGIITAPRFRDLVGDVSDAVRDEARRAFDVGEREMVR